MTTLEEMARDKLADVEARGEPTWSPAEFGQVYEVVGYCDPDLCTVIRRSDGALGTLWYVSNEDGWAVRYFDFEPV